MNIEILVQGDEDTEPYVKTYQYEELHDISVNLIKNRISNNMRINVNEVLVIFVGYIRICLDSSRSIAHMKKNIPKLLFPHQVMIGVPESMRKLTITITSKNTEKKQFSVINPIPIQDYYFHDERNDTID